MTVIRLVDLLAIALSLGAIVWFFFVQSPVLIKRMGSQDFVPLQMRLTWLLFRYLVVVALVLVAAAVAPLATGSEPTTTGMVSAAAAAVAIIVNSLLVVPRALRAGGHTRGEERSDEEDRSVARFASEGGGEASRVWHRLVVLFVLIAAAGLVVHAIDLLG